MLIFQGISSPNQGFGPRRARPNEVALEGGLKGAPRRAVCIGNFDGVHLGHQALIKKAHDLALREALRLTVVTFSPHPRSYFAPERNPGRIQGLRSKAQVLKEMGVDELWLLRFGRHLAAMSAEEFMQRFLHQTLRTQHLVIGDDFCFGAGRRGNFRMLTAAQDQFGWTAHGVGTVYLEGGRVSSSGLRQVIQAGNLQAAEKLMGRPLNVTSRVGHGRQLGRTIGFPTLNLPVANDLLLSGIYVVTVEGLGEFPIQGVASIGRRPTVEQAGKLLLEVHLFNWSGNAYGRTVNVLFHQKLRDEAHYDTLEAMTQQIQRDANNAQRFFQQHPQLTSPL